MIRVLTETSHDRDRDISVTGVRTDRHDQNLGGTRALTPAPEARRCEAEPRYAVTWSEADLSLAEAGAGCRHPLQQRRRRPLLNCSPGEETN